MSEDTGRIRRLLEAKGLPLGIVSAINGATRARVTVMGEAGHAGTVPMAVHKSQSDDEHVAWDGVGDGRCRWR